MVPAGGRSRGRRWWRLGGLGRPDAQRRSPARGRDDDEFAAGELVPGDLVAGTQRQHRKRSRVSGTGLVGGPVGACGGAAHRCAVRGDITHAQQTEGDRCQVQVQQQGGYRGLLGPAGRVEGAGQLRGSEVRSPSSLAARTNSSCASSPTLASFSMSGRWEQWSPER